jgi:hypothetical protein
MSPKLTVSAIMANTGAYGAINPEIHGASMISPIPARLRPIGNLSSKSVGAVLRIVVPRADSCNLDINASTIASPGGERILQSTIQA